MDVELGLDMRPIAAEILDFAEDVDIDEGPTILAPSPRRPNPSWVGSGVDRVMASQLEADYRRPTTASSAADWLPYPRESSVTDGSASPDFQPSTPAKWKGKGRASDVGFRARRVVSPPSPLATPPPPGTTFMLVTEDEKDMIRRCRVRDAKLHDHRYAPY